MKRLLVPHVADDDGCPRGYADEESDGFRIHARNLLCSPTLELSGVRFFARPLGQVVSRFARKPQLSEAVRLDDWLGVRAQAACER